MHTPAETTFLLSTACVLDSETAYETCRHKAMTNRQSAAGVWWTLGRDMSTETRETNVQDQVAQAQPLIGDITFGDWTQRKLRTTTGLKLSIGHDRVCTNSQIRRILLLVVALMPRPQTI